MIVRMFRDSAPTETSLGDLLPKYVTRVLARNGITTVEGVREAYPHGLLNMWGLGLLRFKQIEAALFPGHSHFPEQTYFRICKVKGSSLNGVLTPATVQALARGGVMTPEQLIEKEPKDLLKIQGFGHAKLKEVEQVFYPSKLQSKKNRQ